MTSKSTKLGKRIGSIVVESHAGKEGRDYFYNVRCDCGNVKRVNMKNVSNIKSCGCLIHQDNVYSEVPEFLNGYESVSMRNDNLIVFENGVILSKQNGNYRIRSQTTMTTGGDYKVITYTQDGVQKREYVHRLLAEAFLPNPENKSIIIHFDGNGLNNEISNLAWVTQSEHVKRLYDLGIRKKSGVQCSMCEGHTTRDNGVCHKCQLEIDKEKDYDKRLSKRELKYQHINRDSLNDRQLAILNARLSGATMVEIGRKWGVSRERIRQILKKIEKQEAAK